MLFQIIDFKYCLLSMLVVSIFSLQYYESLEGIFNITLNSLTTIGNSSLFSGDFIIQFPIDNDVATVSLVNDSNSRQEMSNFFEKKITNETNFLSNQSKRLFNSTQAGDRKSNTIKIHNNTFNSKKKYKINKHKQKNLNKRKNRREKNKHFKFKNNVKKIKKKEYFEDFSYYGPRASKDLTEERPQDFYKSKVPLKKILFWNTVSTKNNML